MARRWTSTSVALLQLGCLLAATAPGVMAQTPPPAPAPPPAPTPVPAPAPAASAPKSTDEATLLTGDKLILRAATDGFKALLGQQPPPAPPPPATANTPQIAAAPAPAAAVATAAEKDAATSAQAAAASAKAAVASAATAASAAAAAGTSESAAAASAAAASAPGYVAAPRTKLKVVADDGQGLLNVVVDDTPCDDDNTVNFWTRVASVVGTISPSQAACRYPNKVQLGQAYQIQKSQLDKFGYSRLGFTYGALALPYKYYRSDKSLDTSPTVGPFIGYRFGQTGVSFAVIGSFGLSSLKVSTVQTDKDGNPVLGSDGKPVVESQTVMGISRSIGFMVDLTKSKEAPFRVGLMWGQDHIGSNSTVKDPHAGHSWMAVQIGWEWGRTP